MNYLDMVMQDHTGLQIVGLAERGIFFSIEEGQKTLSFHIATEIVGPEAYTEFLELSRCLEPNDLLEIVISGSPGGQLYGAQVITTAMATCASQIDVVVIGNIASAATMIAMCGDNLIMTQGSSMMIHNASYGVGGKASDIAASVKFSTQDIAETMKHYYRPFLSKKELKVVLNGEEKYYDARECMERFERVKLSRDKKAKKQRKETLQLQKVMLTDQIELLDAALDD